MLTFAAVAAVLTAAVVENLVYQGMPLRIVYKGKMSGDEIKFTRNVAEIADEPFVAKRSKK